MNPDKYETTLDELILNLFVFAGLSATNLDKFSHYELDDFVAQIMEIVGAYQND